MRPLLLSGYGTTVRVSGRTLEVDWRSERRKESYRPHQLPFDSVIVDSMTGSVSFEALRFLDEQEAGRGVGENEVRAIRCQFKKH